MNPNMKDILMHYGVKRRSGRYPWGSGKEPYQRSGDFLSRVEELSRQGAVYVDPKTGKTITGKTAIAHIMGMSSTEFRVQEQLAKHERRALLADRARSLREDGKSLQEIADIMGYKNDSSVRSLLNENTRQNKDKAKVAAEMLKKELEKKGMIDVGAGVEKELGISPTKMKEALYLLEREGYNVYGVGIPQVTNQGKQINTTVLAKKDVEYRDAYTNMGDIQSYENYESGVASDHPNKRYYPASINSDRVFVRYGDQGGLEKDGVIELRRGVDDLDLGRSHYAQVRILVDGTHYLKGMAIYSDNMPDGADIVFNTNKNSNVSKKDVMKKIKDDPNDPFGAYIKPEGQSFYLDKNGKQKLSAINKIKEEGDWDKMSKNLSSQFLSKQPISLIKKQLNLTYKDYVSEYDEIMKLTNPTVKKKMLLDFADQCDGAVLHLKAAALPRQSTQVILPLTGIKDTEVFAPNYRNGEKVALVRYPHAGTFEIPVLTVNNKNASGKSILGLNAKDAVGISSKVAERLSGADFDGDQVVVIPTNSRVSINSTKALDGLKDFNPKVEYSTEGKTNVRLMTKANTQKQMGVVSNLITDMTLKGAPPEDMVRAVKHSMVVIDAEKHKLDYKQSEKDNGIAQLKKQYQSGGASTLISRRKQDVEIPERKGSAQIDPKTGKVTYKESGRTFVDPKTGSTRKATTSVRLLSTVDDLNELSSGTPQEQAYAHYGNQMKSLANQARKSYMSTGNLKYDKGAAQKYRPEVDQLESKLNLALKNAPKERRAQAIANSTVKAKKQSNPDMDKKELKKARQIAIEDARAKVGASGRNTKIDITPKQWEAIQAGAVSDTKLTQILKYADEKVVREYSTPKTSRTLSDAKLAKVAAMKDSGYTNAEIADSMNVSASTISKYLSE
nr:MAG TPA: RNA dependent RNA polymerase [Caudoviricetes sp.]